MKKFKTILLFLIPLIGFSYMGCASKTNQQPESGFPSKAEVIEIIKKVNGNWQATHPNHENSFWHRAAYHTGNMAAYEVTNIDDYKAYSEAWAEHNLWMGAQSDDSTKWKYSYGESDEYVLFGDFQTCFQVYIDLYNLNPDEKKIARAKQVMEYQMSIPNNDYWWWADGLYMAMPVMTKLYKVTNNEMYLDKLYEYFSFARDLMYDSESKLFYRDAKYIYPKHKTDNSFKDFWARGNGWVFAALPKVLDDLPETNLHRAEYIKIYKEMAEAIAASQQTDGSWTRSMLDPQHAPGPETSGTAFFTYGFLWGINNGILDEATYTTVVKNSWRYLAETALQPDGRVGYVQPIGEKAIAGQVVDVNSTADFGVGAFLLAASEMAKYVDKK